MNRLGKLEELTRGHRISKDSAVLGGSLNEDERIYKLALLQEGFRSQGSPEHFDARSQNEAQTPSPGVQLETLEKDDKPLGYGCQGAVRPKTQDTVSGWLNNPIQNQKSFQDKYFDVADIGEMTESGALPIHGNTNGSLNNCNQSLKTQHQKDDRDSKHSKTT